jgi:hypothetical protein
MPRILIALAALLSLSSAANSEPALGASDPVRVTLFTAAHSDNHFVRSLAAGDSASAVPAALAAARSG